MALYSWFSKKETNLRAINQGTSNQDIKNKSHKLNSKSKYIESYTMWPTASVIQGKEVIPPLKNNSANVPAKTVPLVKPIVMSLSTALIVYKA